MITTSWRLFDFAQNLRSGMAMHSKRSESVVTAQHEIHEHSSIEAAARATQYQRNGISPSAPWRFVRDPVKLLLRYLCSRCALVAISAHPRRLYNLWIALPRRTWHFSCVSSTLMLRSWRLNYVYDNCHCATAEQGIKRPRFHCYRPRPPPRRISSHNAHTKDTGGRSYSPVSTGRWISSYPAPPPARYSFITHALLSPSLIINMLHYISTGF